MSFLNVGINESALFLQLPQGKNLLFEGGFSYRRNGGYMERRIVTPFLLRSGITTIDYLILTSVDKNRLDGTNYILRKFKVKEVLTNGSKLNGNLWEAMERKKVLWQNIQHKTHLNFGDLNIEFIKPKKANIRDSREPYPILCKVSFKDTALFFGESILDRGFKDSWSFNGKNNLLYLQEIGKNSMDVIKEISPNVLITRHIPYSLKNGIDKNTKAFETDTNGTVTVITDGKQVYIKTFMDIRYFSYSSSLP
jgi:beta-lactamase superfamily II metal-dependent hydrolase